MAFHESAIFPDNISWGSRGGPGFKTFITTLNGSVAEQRVGKWDTPRYIYDVAYGIKSFEDLATLRDFYYARSGALNGFRFKDFFDYQSTANGLAPEILGYQTLSDTDVEIGIGDGSETQFQLIKKYTNGSITKTRAIRKPVAGSVVIAIDTVSQASGWTVDTTTGIVTFSTAPSIGESVTAGFQFHVPVRFSESVDQALSIAFDNAGSGSISGVQLIELADDVLIENEYYYGGAEVVTFASNTALTANKRVKSLDATTTSLKAFLPALASLQFGGIQFYLENIGSNSIAVRDSGDTTTIVTLAAGDKAILVIADAGSSTKEWRALT